MKIPHTLQWRDKRLYHTGEDFIIDFAGYRKVAVKKTTTYPGEPNCCIDNSLAFAKYGDLDVVQGYLEIGSRLGCFHYWNQCPETKIYWDCTPVTAATYWIKDNQL